MSRRYENEPRDSCPEIDKAIEHMEATRNINEQLRYDNRTLDLRIDAADERIAQLEEEITELKEKLASVMYARSDA
jgi:chaperonin cofactor prefoldin